MALDDFQKIDPATGLLLPADVVPEADVSPGPMAGMFTAPPQPRNAGTAEEQLDAAEATARQMDPAADLQPEPGFSPGAVGGPSPGQQLYDEGYAMGMPYVGTVKSKRPLHAETNQRIAVGEATGQQSTEAQLAQLGEQEQTARWLADQQEQHAAKMREIEIDERARQFAETERREQIIRETEEAALREQQAAQALANTEPMDPGRWWKDADAGKRAGFIIGSIFYGMLGGDPLKLINTQIERDIDAQKHEYGRLGAVQDSAAKSLQAKRNIWADLRANALSDDEAHLQAKNAYLEAFKQSIVAGLHERGVAELGPMHQQLIAQITDQQAANTLRWQQLRAANTKYIYRKQNYAPAMNPETGETTLRPISRAEAKYRGKVGEEKRKAGLAETVDERKAARSHVYDVDMEATKAGFAKQGKAMGSSGMTEDDMRNIRAAGADNKYMAARAMKPVVERMQAIVKQAGGSVPDVYGPFEFGESDHFLDVFKGGAALRSDAKEAWDREADAGLELMVNYFTGAVASPEQRAIAERAFGKGAWSAEQRVRALNQLSTMLDDWVNIREGMLTEEQRQFIRRNPGLPGVSPSSVADTSARDAIPFIDDEE